ncbi:hypothetical protein EXIGLDRAFT_71168 [Exidia glandulosa HHB12029]|uniref:Uncharacterized protein n=1 Tax=Exidia glandulosa HHB12029 TaxID=1314781 RepID=A0A166MJR7_EXIGL|nr:hypothetical protein EXIGLDRAFT_71168 [Exidia glandulosa HHB12029]
MLVLRPSLRSCDSCIRHPAVALVRLRLRILVDRLTINVRLWAVRFRSGQWRRCASLAASRPRIDRTRSSLIKRARRISVSRSFVDWRVPVRFRSGRVALSPVPPNLGSWHAPTGRPNALVSLTGTRVAESSSVSIWARRRGRKECRLGARSR